MALHLRDKYHNFQDRKEDHSMNHLVQTEHRRAYEPLE